MNGATQDAFMAVSMACSAAAIALAVWVHEHVAMRRASTPGRSGVRSYPAMSGLGRCARATFLTIALDLFLVVGTAYVSVIDGGLWGFEALGLAGPPVVGSLMCLSLTSRAPGVGVLAGYLVSLLTIYVLLVALGESLG